MTDPEVEDLLRETFRARESQAPPIARVRTQPRRRPATWIGAGAATLVVLGGAIFAAGALRGPAPATPDEPSLAADAPWPGWRWESSLGAEIQVPEAWTVNGMHCGVNSVPTVFRGVMAAREACLMTEAPTLNVAEMRSAGQNHPSVPANSQFTVDGVRAVRTEGRTEDGRYSGTVVVPDRDVSISVRTTDPRLTKRILDSLRLVDVDHNGCPATADWPKSLPSTDAGPLALPATTARLSVCDYADGRLQASNRMIGRLTEGMLNVLRAAEPGPNQDPRAGECISDPPTQPDLIIRPEGGVPLAVVFSTCTGRGITDGVHTVKLTDASLSALMSPLYLGWGTMAPLE